MGSSKLKLFISFLLTGVASLHSQITVEKFNSIKGKEVTHLISSEKYINNTPDSISELSDLSSDLDSKNYGLRIIGKLLVTESGAYTFYLYSDDYAELYLSTDGTSANKVKIAYLYGASGINELKKASQTSSAINLEAGQEYYIKVLMKEATGADHVNVKWSKDAAAATVIPGANLKPANHLIDLSNKTVTVPLNGSFNFSANFFNYFSSVP